jgi:hypothetical protein
LLQKLGAKAAPFPKADIAPLFEQQTHRKEGRAPAAVQFELALRPVGQAMR